LTVHAALWCLMTVESK